MNPLTVARNAVWDSIDSYGPLRDAFKTKITYDRTTRPGYVSHPYRDRPTSRGECPAIALAGSLVRTEWRLNKSLEIPYTVAVMIWTADGYQSEIEDLYFGVIQAVHQARPEGSNLTFFQQAGISRVVGVESFRLRRVNVDPLNSNQADDRPIRLLQLEGGLTVSQGFNPFS